MRSKFLKPKLDYDDPSYQAFEQVYDALNRLADDIESLDIKEYVVKFDPTTSSPFDIHDNKLPHRRIVIYGETVYEFIKTSYGWKHHQLS